ncbi:MAG: hypothetical protein UZ15_CFX003000117 [Chloroflexi bacterium OLB15]|nr:MAG: hypothetical protein UZ15_CFX003000117 [Chloroflexi bacterium OLB15]
MTIYTAMKGAALTEAQAGARLFTFHQPFELFRIISHNPAYSLFLSNGKAGT